jgi:hypothetical protein
MKPIVTKQSMIEALNAASDQKKIRYIGRALVAIFKYQTETEKRNNSTDNNNNVGFSSSDAKSGSITAKYFMKYGTLQGWMIDNWMTDWRGAPRITKYHKQLNVVANQQPSLKIVKSKTKFKHDQPESEKHVFVGTNSDGHDVWYGIKFGEIIVRFGNAPQEYKAHPVVTAAFKSVWKESYQLVQKFMKNREGV